MACLSQSFSIHITFLNQRPLLLHVSHEAVERVVIVLSIHFISLYAAHDVCM